MDAMLPLKNGPTQAWWASSMRDRAFDLIRSHKLMETASEYFLQVLNAGTISTNMFLRRLHNFAAGMHWLPSPVLPKLNGPPWSTRSAGPSRPRNTRESSSASTIPKSGRITSFCGTWAARKRTLRI